MNPPETSEFAPFYETYVAKVRSSDVLELLEKAPEELGALLSEVPSALESFSYAPGKWSLRQALGHVVDVERLFSYRALHIARSDPSDLPGMEQDAWATASNAEDRTLADLLGEFAGLRQANHAFFSSFDDRTLARSGTASGASITVRALVYIVAGHEIHHRQVFRELYLPGILEASRHE